MGGPSGRGGFHELLELARPADEMSLFRVIRVGLQRGRQDVLRGDVDRWPSGAGGG